MRRFFLKLFRRWKLQQDLDAEIAFHREMAEEANNPIPLGNTTILQEQARDLWRFNFLENLWRDVLYAARGLRRSPGFVASALLSLALGIGANATVFSLAVEFLMSEPSVTDAGSVVSVRLGGNSHVKLEYLEFLRDSGVFQDVVGQNEETSTNWNDGVETRPVLGMSTSKNYFSALGVPFALGRGWIPSDPLEVVVLHHRFWMKHFQGDPSAVGRSMNLNGRLYTIVGVLPESHRTLIGYGFSPDIYMPRYLADTLLAIYGRLKPGMSIGEAKAGVQTVAENLDRAYPGPFQVAKGCQVIPVAGLARFQQEKQIMAVGQFFAMLLVIVGLVLLIACVNVASLLLARASARRRELAVRLSLGASRGRLIQQMVTESLLLSILGTILGLGLAQTVTSLLTRVQLPLPLPIRIQAEVDWRVTLYGAFLAIFATVACGVLPAWQSVRESLASNLHRESKMRLRRVLVVAQVATCFVVLVTGAIFVRNLMQSASMSPGFDVRRTVRAEVHLPPEAYRDPARKLLYFERSVKELQAIPGIEFAAAARIIPFTDATNFSTDLTLSATGERKQARFHWNAITADYFRAMDIPVLEGRPFSHETRDDEKVVIVNRTFAQRYLGGQRAAGTMFLWGDAKGTYRVVGVVGDTKNITIGEESKPQMYQPLAQIGNNRPKIQFVLRSATPPATQVAAVRDVLRRMEPAAGIEVSTLYSSIGLAFLPSQVGAVLLGAMGLLGLTLATIGVYGVMAYSVARRTREIGVRIAIGADRRAISLLLLREAGALVGYGAGAGLAVGILVTRPLTAFIVPGLSPSDPLSFLAVSVVLGVTGVLAALGPLQRALSIDPASCLRCD